MGLYDVDMTLAFLVHRQLYHAIDVLITLDYLVNFVSKL